MNSPEEPAVASGGIHKRLTWLLVCLGVGVLVGVAGSALTDNFYWYLAIPAAVAAGWLVVADPSACEPSPGRGSDALPRKHDAP